MSVVHATSFLLGIAVLGAGCFRNVPRDEILTKTLARQAAFDLGCRADQLAFVDLGAKGSYYFKDDEGVAEVDGISLTQGVTGCGKKGTYVYTRSGWIMNTDQGTAR